MNKKRSDMSKLFARINATAGFVRVNTTILELGVAFSFTIEFHIYVHYPKLSGLFFWNKTYLTITMPKDMKDSDISFSSVSGEVDLPSGIQAKKITVHSTSGEVQADDVQCEEFEYGNVSGDLDLTGYISERISVDTVSGDSDIMIYGMTEKIIVSGVSGNVRITLEKDIEFKFDFNTVSGDFDCEIPVYSQGGRSDRTGYTDTSADLDIDVNTVSGDLNIRN